MNLKKMKIISTLLMFVLSVIYHSIYDKFPNLITSLLFPVNESIWEHMKLIYLGYVTCFIVEYFIIIFNNLKTKNLNTSVIFNILFNIVIFLIVFIPIYNKFGENIIVTISIYFITIIITQILSYKILILDKEFTFLNKYTYLILIIMWLILVYLTYYPPKLDIFIDYLNKKIGLSNYY